jgi:tRNA-uridine 2-sulfurtransferase
MSHKGRVVVGLSGGVDSSVAAHLLIEQGYEVIGIFMRNWHDESVIINNECPWIDDSQDAMLVAECLGIPFHVLDMSAEYKTRIVDYMFREYEMGRTPNPDVLCNREVKFDLFLNVALQLKADFVATGHYCQKSESQSNGQIHHGLLAGADMNKDQSYFLCQLNQFQLSKALFPIGHLEKSEVRSIANQIGLPTANKKDSQGLCFIGKVKLPTFLQQQLKPKKGDIIEIPANAPLELKYQGQDEPARTTSAFVLEPSNGIKIGEHNGAHYYTTGQRKGLGVGGKAEPLFILGTDATTNIVYVGQGEQHPGLVRHGIFIDQKEIHWLDPMDHMQVNENKVYDLRYRYRQELFKVTLIQKEEGLHIVFHEPQKSIAAGQFAAWYEGNRLIGSGVIHE